MRLPGLGSFQEIPGNYSRSRENNKEPVAGVERVYVCWEMVNSAQGWRQYGTG